jgi:hypothetical protein
MEWMLKYRKENGNFNNVGNANENKKTYHCSNLFLSKAEIEDLHPAQANL